MQSDCLIIGGGIGGLVTALHLARRNFSIRVLFKGEASHSATAIAQGGIAAVMGADDSSHLHMEDTLKAGGGICLPKAVEACVEEGPDCIRDLMAWGASFSRDAEGLALGREGGHSRRRVVRADDMTGREIQRALLAAAESKPNITLMENHPALGLIHSQDLGVAGPARCLGAVGLDLQSGLPTLLSSPCTVLATGGAGRMFCKTTNPPVATGDGLAMAFRCGATLANLEFIQFHPTCLHHPQGDSFLISEALRGEGGVLRRLDGTPLMAGRHPMGDLAPRDVVARAIYDDMKSFGHSHVHLDMTGIDPLFLQNRFPGIFAKLAHLGIEMSKEPIPVTPAAHYLCGGVLTDLHGESDLANLFAVGEVASSGLHGANRLASNSLLEGAVFGNRVANRIAGRLVSQEGVRQTPLEMDPKQILFQLLGNGAPGKGVGIGLADSRAEIFRTLGRCMWNGAGIERTDRSLDQARNDLDRMGRRLSDFRIGSDHQFPSAVELLSGLELANLHLVAGLTVECAARRKESRGTHHNRDHSEPSNPQWRRYIMVNRQVPAHGGPDLEGVGPEDNGSR